MKSLFSSELREMRFRLHSLLQFTALVAVGLTLYRWWPLDGVMGSVGLLAFGDDTIWAKGYTDSGFRAAKA
jgi:hypothetical protein